MDRRFKIARDYPVKQWVFAELVAANIYRPEEIVELQHYPVAERSTPFLILDLKNIWKNDELRSTKYLNLELTGDQGAFTYLYMQRVVPSMRMGVTAVKILFNGFDMRYYHPPA